MRIHLRSDTYGEEEHSDFKSIAKVFLCKARLVPGPDFPGAFAAASGLVRKIGRLNCAYSESPRSRRLLLSGLHDHELNRPRLIGRLA